MTAWYDKAIFYHMYPLGMTGAPFANPYPVSNLKIRYLLKVREGKSYLPSL